MNGKRPSGILALGLLAAAKIAERVRRSFTRGTEFIGPTDIRFWRTPLYQFTIVLAVAIFLTGAFIVLYLLFVGPHMYNQPLIKAFQAQMPDTPAGVVPVVDPIPNIPTTQEAEKMKNPVPPTPQNLARGKVYYEYYCVFCHGDGGRGDGPVGLSYDPVPSDLGSKKIRNYSDGRLFQAMLSGTGHAPILNRVIMPEFRWHLVLYTRHLSTMPAPPRTRIPSTATHPVTSSPSPTSQAATTRESATQP